MLNRKAEREEAAKLVEDASNLQAAARLALFNNLEAQQQAAEDGGRPLTIPEKTLRTCLLGNLNAADRRLGLKRADVCERAQFAATIEPALLTQAVWLAVVITLIVALSQADRNHSRTFLSLALFNWMLLPILLQTNGGPTAVAMWQSYGEAGLARLRGRR